MKKFRTLIAAFCLALTYAHAQNTYLWPITGVQPGTRHCRIDRFIALSYFQ